MRQSDKYCYDKTPMQTFLDILLFRKILNQDSDSIFKFGSVQQTVSNHILIQLNFQSIRKENIKLRDS